MAAGVAFEGAVVSPALQRTERGMALLRQLERRGVLLEELSEQELTDVADTDTPQCVVAVIAPPRWSTDDLSNRLDAPLLVLDGVRDPGNMGAIVRTAYALGAAGVILLSGNARANHPKVLRGAMGATFRLPLVQLTLDEFTSWLERTGVSLWAAAATGPAVTTLDPPPGLALLVGSEGSGIRPELLELASQTVSVPMAREVDSLNVAVAIGILLHEIISNA